MGLAIGNAIGVPFGGGQSWADLLIARMINTGEVVSSAESDLIKFTINSLQNNHLGCNYLQKLDGLWITNSRIGRASAKLNWIKDAHNLIEEANGGTLTYSSGFASDGTKSYLRTNYNPTNNGIKYTGDSASFGVRTSGALGTDASYRGHGCTGLMINKYGSSNNRNYVINGIGGFNVGLARTIQMIALSYSTITGAFQYSRYPKQSIAGGALALCNEEIALLAVKSTSSGIVMNCAATEILEAAYVGSYLTAVENDLLNSIIDGYIRGVQRVEGNAVCFSTDDGYATNYSLLYPLFVSRGIKASFHIITSFIGGAGRNTWAELLEMQNAGFDIGDHSVDHPNYTTLTDAQLTAQFDGVDSAFVSNGLALPRHGGYPYGAYSAAVMAKAALYRDTMRGGAGAYVYKASDKFHLESYDISDVGNTYAKIGTTLERIDGCMTQADKYILLFCHEAMVGDTSGKLGLNQLNRILDYIDAIGMVVVSQKELHDNFLT